MLTFIKTLSSIIFYENSSIKVATLAFRTSRFAIPIYAGAKLTPEISQIVLKAKENNDLIARKFLAKLVCDAIDLTRESNLNLILIPSRQEAIRIRGIKHLNLMVNEVKKYREVTVYDVLKHTRKVRDQSQLDHKERFENLKGAFEVRAKFKDPLPNRAFLLDDLVTTGATIHAAAMALKVRNIQLLGVISACATSVFTE